MTGSSEMEDYMSKKRIYQIARELNVNCKDVIDTAKANGIKVGNHMSMLDESQEKMVKENLSKKEVKNTKSNTSSVPKTKVVTNKINHPQSKSGNVSKKKDNFKRHTTNSSNKPKNNSVKASNNNHVSHNHEKQTVVTNHSNNQNSYENHDHAGTTKKFNNKKKSNNFNNSYSRPKFNKKNKKKNKKERRQDRRNIKKAPVTQRKNKPLPEVLTYTVGMSVADIAKKIHREPAEIIKKLFMMGVVVNQNQSLDKDTIEVLADDYGIKAEEKIEVDVSDIDKFFEEEKNNHQHLENRPPVVTIMGHVDHGKTTLLDHLRHSHITAGEAGGITQHIGAYQIKHDGKTITFLDTPGHAAFTSMRARGADITDITVLVVAADDGVMPQTIEAIHHSQAAGVPIIVAVNKIDKPGANPNHVMEQLTEYGLIPEDWGGDTIFVNISAKYGKNIDELLDMILLQAEMLELKANPKQHGAGSVIEARLDKGKGSVASLLVQEGTLHIGDPIVVGNTFGRVRTMTNDRGRQIRKAKPGTPVEITGLNDVPDSGDRFVTFDDEKTALAAGEKRAEQALIKERNKVAHVTLDNLFETIKEGEMKKVDIIIKADVQGSVEALSQSLQKINVEGVRVNIIHQGVGAINESDITLAEASNAIIIGFNVRPTSLAKQQAEANGVDIRLHNVIYKAIDEVETAMKGMLEPEYQEKVTGQVEIRQTYKVSKLGTIGGAYVTDGYIRRDSGVRIIRDGVVIYEGKLASLKRFKDDVKEVKAGYECGLMIDKYNDIKVGDQLEAFVMEEVPVK